MRLNHGLADTAINWAGGMHHAKKAEVGVGRRTGRGGRREEGREGRGGGEGGRRGRRGEREKDRRGWVSGVSRLLA